MAVDRSRRSFFSAAFAGAVLIGCHKDETREPHLFSGLATGKDKDKDNDEDVSATEDLMREHGVLRRILVVYRESALRLRLKAGPVPASALNKAALLMRRFGEDYHEKQLEEAHVFPAVKSAGGPAAGEIDTLLAQHQRAREITDYLVSTTQGGSLPPSALEPLSRTLDAFARMYEEHAAREDTIVFQAWKKSLSKKAMKEQGELFEDIEHKTFGKDGFDDGVEQIAAIEASMGLDPAQLLAPSPPR